MKLLILTQTVDTQNPVLGFFHRWIEEFAKHAEQVIVICLKEGEHNLPENVKVLSLGKESGSSRLKYIWNFYRYIIRERKNYDSVFVHMNQIYVILGGIFWRFWGKKVGLWYAHGHVPLSLRIAAMFADIVFTSTESGFRIDTPKKKVVGQGIDTELFKPQTGDSKDFTICSVGRISSVKDYETLIKAIAPLEDVALKIVGGAEGKEQEVYLAKLQSLVATLGIEEKITFLGGVPNSDIPDILANCNLMVNTSHTGSLDKTMLEAMAMGIPVLTCNEAMNDVLGEYRDILMFPKKDAHALTEKIRYCMDIKDESIRSEMRRIVEENHTVKRLVDKIIQYVQ